MNAGEVIKKLRYEEGLTQQELAERLQVSKASVQKYEQGDVLNLKAETLRKLCLLFNVPPFVFVFPEYINAEKESISEAHKWSDFLNVMAVYNDLSDNGKNKVNDFLNILNIAEHYTKEKD